METFNRTSVFVVVTIAVLIVGLLLPALSKVRSVPNRMVCLSNLKQLAVAVHYYHETHEGLPHASWPHGALPPERRLSWLAALLPYLEEDTLFRQLDDQAGWDAAMHRAALSVGIRTILCPAAPDSGARVRPNVTHYVGIAGVGRDAAALSGDDPRVGLFGYDRDLTLDDVLDGTGNTLLLIETARDNGPWLAGGRPTVRGVEPGRHPYVGAAGQFGGYHPGRDSFPGAAGPVNTAFADGSVRSLKGNVSPAVLEALATVAGGEKVDPEDY